MTSSIASISSRRRNTSERLLNSGKPESVRLNGGSASHVEQAVRTADCSRTTLAFGVRAAKVCFVGFLDFDRCNLTLIGHRMFQIVASSSSAEAAEPPSKSLGFIPDRAY